MEANIADEKFGTNGFVLCTNMYSRLVGKNDNLSPIEILGRTYALFCLERLHIPEKFAFKLGFVQLCAVVST